MPSTTHIAREAALRLAPWLLLAACGGAAATRPPPPPSSSSSSSPSSPSPAPPRDQPAPAVLDAALEPLRGLVGTWAGADPDRRSSGQFTFAPELGGKILVRRGYNVSAAGRHEDLLIVFPGAAGLRASYFDNEGHTLQYAVSASPAGIEMLSDDAPGQPRFKLRYDARGPGELAVEFAIAAPGSTEFRRYTGALVQRVPWRP